MKNLLLGLMMLFALSVFAQSTHTVNFETPGVGADWVWTVSENADNPPLEFVTNPVIGGINTSTTVAKFTARLAGNPWALCFTSGDGAFTFDATNSIVKIMVFKTVISDVGFKVEGIGPATQLIVANTLINQWEELTFDFGSVIGQTYSTLVIIPDFDFTPRSQENIIYFDNIQVPDGVPVGPLPEPTVAAPTPTQNPGDVISMFSDAYTDVPVDTWLTVWSQGVLEDVLIAGNPTKKYSSVTFVGIETTGANLIDASAMNHFHIDVWSPDANDFKIKLVDFGADAAYGGGDDTEHEITFPAPVTETWISYDIPLSDFTGLASTEHLAQLIMVKAPLGTIFIDNVFYYYGDVIPTEPTVAAPTPVQDPGDVISMFSDAYTDVPVDTWLTGWSEGVLEDVLIVGNPTKKYSALNFAGIETTGANLINASAMTHFHIDVWSPDANDFKIKLVDWGADAAYGGGDDTEHELTYLAPATNTWISYDIPLSDFVGLASTEHLAQLIMVKAPLGTIYVDNVFYYFEGPKPYLALDVQDNFENDGWGTVPAWSFQDPDLLPLPVVADPVLPTNNVASYIRSGAFQWTNAQFILNHRMDLTYRNMFSIKVYFPSSNDYSGALTPTAAIKLQNSLLGGNAWTTQEQILITVTDFDQWITLTYDFGYASTRDDFDQVVVQFGGEGHNVPGMFYFDDIKLMGYRLSGNVYYGTSGLTKPMATNTTVILTPGPTVSTGPLGYYEITDLANGSYKMSGTTTKTGGGITTADGITVARYAVGIGTLSNLQLRSADVNMSNSISTSDGILVKRRAVGLSSNWSAPVYVFDGPFGAPNPVLTGLGITISGMDFTQEFRTLCSGDVNGSFSPTAN